MESDPTHLHGEIMDCTTSQVYPTRSSHVDLTLTTNSHLGLSPTNEYVGVVPQPSLSHKR